MRITLYVADNVGQYMYDVHRILGKHIYRPSVDAYAKVFFMRMQFSEKL